jgi:hypothetical protein
MIQTYVGMFFITMITIAVIGIYKKAFRRKPNKRLWTQKPRAAEERIQTQKATLKEIDSLFVDQDPVFTVALARSLMAKAIIYPIEKSDIWAIQKIIKSKSDRTLEMPCPQISHLKKIIEKAEMQYDL